jgi:hypothetical protein
MCLLRRLPYNIKEAAMSDEHSAPRRIEIPGDTLVLDEEFCALVLGGAVRRTSQRMDKDGFPYIYVANRKYRPLNEGRAWLAARIKRRNKPRRSTALAHREAV